MASGVTTWCAWPGHGESVTELKPFRNFLLHSYTCCSDRHASPYWTCIRPWMSMGFTPSLRKKRMTEHCSSLVHVASGATFFTPLLCHHVVFLHHTATCRPLFKPWVSQLPTYRTIEWCFEFLTHFYGFHLTHLRTTSKHWNMCVKIMRMKSESFIKLTQVTDQEGHNIQMCSYRRKRGKHLLEKHSTNTTIKSTNWQFIKLHSTWSSPLLTPIFFWSFFHSYFHLPGHLVSLCPLYEVSWIHCQALPNPFSLSCHSVCLILNWEFSCSWCCKCHTNVLDMYLCSYSLVIDAHHLEATC